jgi:hypothetical protein
MHGSRWSVLGNNGQMAGSCNLEFLVALTFCVKNSSAVALPSNEPWGHFVDKHAPPPTVASRPDRRSRSLPCFPSSG